MLQPQPDRPHGSAETPPSHLAFEFDRYLLASYPEPPMPDTCQYHQLRDAWMGGALSALALQHVGHRAEISAELDRYGSAARKAVR